ncbi:DNA polymerase III subunit beta [Anaerobiospirillum sp. NML120448]|uniref:DNA polymerase III subunit beta n=1 Tax=Anaerobiospirillum sp. NML120448 TaxID=2932816 RepID=UPI001FF23E88|nr:DNA polymerase III subunit beta [Anaerobiospirillum sp. NML120448]MCK0514321.1 DNA polymerase III subunit beta [Anaerobiospirillum sp. NML120448]
MKFTVPVQTIISPIAQVASICTTNTSSPDDLTQYLLFIVKKDLLTLVGTDNAVQLKAEIPLPEGACESEGTFLMEASKAKDFFKTLGSSDDVSFELHSSEEEVLNIVSSQARFSVRIRMTSEEQFLPSFDEDAQKEIANIVSIEENKLRYMIEKSLFCAARESYQEFFKGLRFEIRIDELSIFALDGHRMAAVDVKLDQEAKEDFSFIMTYRGVTELQKLLSASITEKIELGVSANFATAKIGFYTITNRLLKCPYPAVRGVIPKNCNPEIAINVEEFKTYVKRVALFSNKRVNMINLVFSQDSLGLHCQNSDHEIASARVSIAPIDDHREVNLNVDYLKDFLNAIDSSEVVFCFAPPYSNTLIRPKDEVNDLGIRVRYVVSHIVV